jgi:hypothetical protein
MPRAFLQFGLVILLSLAAGAAYSQTSQQTFDSNMKNADQVYQRQQQENARQETTKNGTSQYSGPKAYPSGASGSPVVGYQKSIK